MKVNIQEIQISDNYRIELGQLDALRENIKNYGLIHPIPVKELPSGGSYRYELVAGYRRLKALEQLGYREIPVHLMSSKDELNQFDIYLSENMERKEFNPMEISEFILIRKRKWEQIHGQIRKGPSDKEDNNCTNVQLFYEQTGVILKKTAREIYRFLQLQGLDNDLKVEVESGRVHYRQAIKIQSDRNREQMLKKYPKAVKVQIPEPPPDIMKMEYYSKMVICIMNNLYSAIQELPGKEINIQPMELERIFELEKIAGELMHWLSGFQKLLQNEMISKATADLNLESIV